MTKINELMAVLIGALSLLTGACDTQEDLTPEDLIDTEAEPEAEPEAVDEASEDEQFRAWTGYVSEENPPVICPNYHAARGFDCWGSYCDNVAIYCYYARGGAVGGSYWTSYFSEEGTGSADERHCTASNSWMTGVACSGRYCDNLSLRCTTFPGTWTGSCYWSGVYSEEQAPFVAPQGYFIKGMECSGSYCDNKQYRYCRMHY